MLWGGDALGEAGGFQDPAENVRETVFENGLTVLTLEDHSTPVVSFQMWVKVGARDETRFTGEITKVTVEVR